MRKILLFTYIMTLCNFSALAQEKFQGFYGGITLSHSDAKDHGKEFEFDGSQDVNQKNEPNGESVSLNFGYNEILTNSFLIGFDGSLEKNNVDDKVQQTYLGVEEECCTVKSKIKESIYLGLKLGKVITEDTLMYLSAGKALKHIQRDFNDTDISEYHSDTVWQNGWYFGVGIEKYINNNLTILIDYKNIDLGERTYYGFPNWGIEKHDYRENNYRVGINYYF